MSRNKTKRTPRRSWIAFSPTLLVAFQIATPIWAWGRLGHRVISRIVEKHLTAKAKAEIIALLEPGESLADASLWADENRGRLPKTAPWHYVDVPLDEPQYDSKFSGDVSTKGCVVDKINEFRAVLKDQTKSKEDRRFALRFLIHCIEDLHMPMHVGDNGDKGGNRTHVRFFDRGTINRRAFTMPWPCAGSLVFDRRRSLPRGWRNAICRRVPLHSTETHLLTSAC
jgi:hypothetical protein